MAQLSGGAPAIKDKKRVLILGQFVGHFVKLAARNIDSRGDVPVGVFRLVGPRINDRDLFGLRHSGVRLHERHIHNVVKLSVGFGRLGCQLGAGTAKCECQSKNNHKG